MMTSKTPLASPPKIVPESSPSFASSFVFVESSTDTPKISRNLSRHSTVIHNSPNQADDQGSIFLPNEQTMAVVHNIKVLHPVGAFSEIVTVTNYRILLSNDILIPLASVLDIKSRQSASSLNIDIKTKDCRFFQFVCEDPSLNKAGFVKLLNSLAFENGVFTDSETSRKFSIHQELERLVAENPSFVVSELNSDYSVCSTYPSRFIVPKSATREMILGAAKFRDKGRFPVLAWTGKSFGSVWRSSQPKSSLLNRSTDDEQYLKSIGVMYIIDCRPMLNAYANIANAGGVESLGNYHEGIELWFASIQNIHHVRDSWEKMFLLAQQHSGMVVASSGSQTSWLHGLEGTGWMDHMISILRATSVLVEKVGSGLNVLCRCSHGLDRTPQVVSLGMVCLDGYYRTIEGFAVLIEKEWCHMGHRFASRYSMGKAPTDETSPIFSQWIDCVYQIVEQNRNAFEFTSKYLVWILAGMISGRFRNFSADCEKERNEINSGNDIWETLWKHKAQFVNTNFVDTTATLIIDYRACMMRVFSDVWLTPFRPII